MKEPIQLELASGVRSVTRYEYEGSLSARPRNYMSNVSLHWPSQVLFLVGPAKDVSRLSRGKSHSPLTVGTTPGRRRESNGSGGKEGTLLIYQPVTTDKENKTQTQRLVNSGIKPRTHSRGQWRRKISSHTEGETFPRDSEGIKKDVTIRRPTGLLGTWLVMMSHYVRMNARSEGTKGC